MASHPSFPFSGLPEKTGQDPKESQTWDHQKPCRAPGKDLALAGGRHRGSAEQDSPIVFPPCPFLSAQLLPLEQLSPWLTAPPYL